MFVVRQGQLWRDGIPFVSVGFNYHPSAEGCQYWQEWNTSHIEEDFQQMAELGFNTVRFFVFWSDFEPKPGQYDGEKISRLKELVAIAQRYQLLCIPTLLTIWMNGQLFDLPWRSGRDLWTDPDMLAHERAYVRCIADALRDADNILAYDLGDEVIHVDFACAQSLPQALVVEWLQSLSDAIREVDPGALVLQSNEASAILGKHEFRPENSQALDLIAIHGYPVWSPFTIESIASYKATCFVPFLVQFARVYGSVLVDEMGCYGGDEETTRGYLRAATHSAIANGACGIIAWCWQDITSKAKPYDLRPGERFVGLMDGSGNPKPALTTFQAFAQQATVEWAGLTIPTAPIGVYVPEHRDEGGANYLQPDASYALAAFYSYLLLKRAHLQFEFTHGSLERYQLVICPSVHHITLHEQEMLADYVAHGGLVYFSTADYLHGFGGEELFGVQLRDFTLGVEEMAGFLWEGQEYPVLWTSPGGRAVQIPVIKATRAEVLAVYPNGTPAFTRHSYGQGRAYYLNAPLEEQLNAPFRSSFVSWQMIYDFIAREAHVRREIDIDAPEVELAVLKRDKLRYGFIINHSPNLVEATLSWHMEQQRNLSVQKITIEGKGVQIITWET